MPPGWMESKPIVNYQMLKLYIEKHYSEINNLARN